MKCDGKFYLMGMLLAAALFFGGCRKEALSGKPKDEMPIPVQVVHPHRGTIYRYINLPGEVHPLLQVTLFAKVDGYLTTLMVDKGDAVKKGDLIAEIDVPQLRASRAKQIAEVQLAEAELQQMTQIAPAPGALQTEGEAARDKIAVAKGKLAVARGNLEYTESMLAYARVTAPFDGIITKRFVDPGAYIPVPNAADTPEAAAIVNLTDFKTLRLQVAVPEIDVPYIHLGQSIRWTTDVYPGEAFEGAVTRTYWALDPATRTMLTEVQLTNRDMMLKPEMLVNARIALQKKEEALLAPVSALVKEKNASFVLLPEAGTVNKIQIQTGFNDGTNVEIVTGIKLTDLVILSGQAVLRKGQRVTASEVR